MRIGQGYDVHKIKPGKGMVLGGITIECDYSIEAHSDGAVSYTHLTLPTTR